MTSQAPYVMQPAEESTISTQPDEGTREAVRARSFWTDERPIRALNITVASIGLVVSLPLWVIIAIAIKLTSRGPLFYTQTRVGLDQRRSRTPADRTRRAEDIGGKPFVIVKFRTMTVDAERHGAAVWAAANDQRVTAVGGFLRSCRLDELPQLLNVIRGDMNLVGPRPERPQFVTQLREKIPDYQMRHRVRPGITGHAQVNLQYDTSVEDVRRKVEHDLEYISRRTVWEDLKIMLKTIPVMLFRKGGW